MTSHADGSIIRYFVSEGGKLELSGRLLNNGVPAYALAWSQSHVIAAGSDKKIFCYDNRGKIAKIFDFSKETEEKEFTVACCSPSGQSVAIGSWNKVYNN